MLSSSAEPPPGGYSDMPGNQVLSVPELISIQRNAPDRDRFRDLACGVRAAGSATLVSRLETTLNPLILWAIHLELDARGVPPALRWPGCDANEQAVYVTWTADLFWICKRIPEHCPQFRSWQGLFKHAPGSKDWHHTAHRNFQFVYPRYSLAHWCAKGLGLTAEHRALLMTMPTTQMHADRRGLTGRHFDDLHRLLLDACIERPDKSNRRSPQIVASRRACMWRTFVLSGRSYTRGAAHWNLLTGEAMTRQAYTKQVQAAAETLRCAAL